MAFFYLFFALPVFLSFLLGWLLSGFYDLGELAPLNSAPIIGEKLSELSEISESAFCYFITSVAVGITFFIPAVTYIYLGIAGKVKNFDSLDPTENEAGKLVLFSIGSLIALQGMFFTPLVSDTGNLYKTSFVFLPPLGPVFICFFFFVFWYWTALALRAAVKLTSTR